MVLTEKFNPWANMAEAIRLGRGDEVKAALEKALKGREELRAYFAGNANEMARADLEIDLEIHLDMFALSGKIESNKICGDAIITALAHNLARYVFLANPSYQGSREKMVIINERVLEEIKRLLIAQEGGTNAG